MLDIVATDLVLVGATVPAELSGLSSVKGARLLALRPTFKLSNQTARINTVKYGLFWRTHTLAHHLTSHVTLTTIYKITSESM